MNWYLLGLLIMSLIFVCGYKIGHLRGWYHGYCDYGSELEEKSKFRATAENDGNVWRYKEKAATRVNK